MINQTMMLPAPINVVIRATVPGGNGSVHNKQAATNTPAVLDSSPSQNGNQAYHPTDLPSTPTTNRNRPNLGQLDHEIKEITTLYNTAVAVGSSLNLPELCWTLYKESSRLIDTTNFALAVYDEPTDTLNFVLA
ncbi:MAG: hypothetical protein AB1801_01405, partial [Chloroflexota bacterium]